MRKYITSFFFFFLFIFIVSGTVQAAQKTETVEYEYKKITNDYGSGIQLVKYMGNDTEVTIPSEINGKPVVEIGIHCFDENKVLKKVTIPDSVTRLGGFRGCVNLETVVMGNQVRELISGTFDHNVNGAFTDCSSLKEIELPDSMLKIQEYAFANCSSLERMRIPQGVQYIERGGISKMYSIIRCCAVTGHKGNWDMGI